MDQRLNDISWRRRESRCLLLSLLPGLGWFAFLFMGKRSGRKQFTLLGAVYALISILCMLVPLVGDLLASAKYSLNRVGYGELYQFLLYTYPTIRSCCQLFLVVVWLLCIGHTFSQKKAYLQYLSLQQVRQPARPALTADNAWRKKNLMWLWLNCVPCWFGFGLAFAGGKLRKKGLTALGIGSVVAMEALSLVRLWLDGLNTVLAIDLSFPLVFFSVPVLALLHISCLLTCLLWREDYLDARALQWQQDVQHCPKLAEDGWRRSNSRWHIWTAFPWVGGIGISLAGLRAKQSKKLVLGVGLCLANAVVLISNNALAQWFTDTYSSYTENRPLFATIALLPRVLQTLYLFTIFAGLMIHWPCLKGRAMTLQGYGSEFEREADLYQRTAARAGGGSTAAPAATREPPAQTPAAVAPAPVAPEPVHPVRTESSRVMDLPETPAQPQGLLDINHCTQADYLRLPGFTVAQAHRAMNHRAEHGSFRDGDEFVSVLGIKPHFAVQIFPLITTQADAPAPTPKSDTPRRRLDL